MRQTSAFIAALVAGLPALTLAACADTNGRQDAGARNAHTSQSRTSVTKGRITARIILDKTTAPADGQSIHGYIQVNNGTHEPITLPDGPCDGWVRVGLTNRRIKFVAPMAAGACGPGRLPVGTSRTPITVETTYAECHQGPAAQSSMPRCQGSAHNVMPDLPAGRYRAKTLFTDTPSPRIPEPEQVTVTLTAS